MAKEAFSGTTYQRVGGKDPEMGIYKKVESERTGKIKNLE